MNPLDIRQRHKHGRRWRNAAGVIDLRRLGDEGRCPCLPLSLAPAAPSFPGIQEREHDDAAEADQPGLRLERPDREDEVERASSEQHECDTGAHGSGPSRQRPGGGDDGAAGGVGR